MKIPRLTPGDFYTVTPGHGLTRAKGSWYNKSVPKRGKFFERKIKWPDSIPEEFTSKTCIVVTKISAQPKCASLIRMAPCWVSFRRARP